MKCQKERRRLIAAETGGSFKRIHARGHDDYDSLFVRTNKPITPMSTYFNTG